MSDPIPPPRGTLTKLHSWSSGDEQTWRRRHRCHLRRRLRRARSDVTDDDVDELRAWFELGFRFDDASNMDPKLARTFPALEIVTKPLGRTMSTSSMERVGPADGDGQGWTKGIIYAWADPGDRVANAFDLGEDPKVVKARLKQWAQVVACVVQQQSNSQVKIFSSSN